MSQISYLTLQEGENENYYLNVIDNEKRNKDLRISDYIQEKGVYLEEHAIPDSLPVVLHSVDPNEQATLASIPYTLKVPLLSSSNKDFEAVYTLRAIVTSGYHACTWVPVKVNGKRTWVLYNDSKVTIYNNTQSIRKIIREKAYLLLFDLAGKTEKAA